MVARLVPAELRLHTPDGEVQRYAQGEGWLEVFANRARVLIAEAVPPDQLEAGELRERLEEAEQRLSDADEGSAAHELAEREKAARPGPSWRSPNAARRSLSRVQARALTEELIAYDTSTEEGIKLCAGFVKGWLDARDIAAEQMGVRGLPVTVAEVGPRGRQAGAPSPRPPRRGSGPAGTVHSPHRGATASTAAGAYDMKGALACLLLALADLRSQDQVRVRLGIVPDEESEEETDRGGDRLVEAGFVGDFAITGEPTDLNVGVAAKGRARHATAGQRTRPRTAPRPGWAEKRDPPCVRGVSVNSNRYRLRGQSSELFDRPSINLGRILGGDALNKVPDSCVIDVDVRYLPEQDPGEILAQVRGLQGTPRDLDLLPSARRGGPGIALRPRPAGRRRR